MLCIVGILTSVICDLFAVCLGPYRLVRILDLLFRPSMFANIATTRSHSFHNINMYAHAKRSKDGYYFRYFAPPMCHHKLYLIRMTIILIDDLLVAIFRLSDIWAVGCCVHAAHPVNMIVVVVVVALLRAVLQLICLLG